ncbi:hypothetical protein V6N13_039012 [Hibiscus sabdariffa]
MISLFKALQNKREWQTLYYASLLFVPSTLPINPVLQSGRCNDVDIDIGLILGSRDNGVFKSSRRAIIHSIVAGTRVNPVDRFNGQFKAGGLCWLCRDKSRIGI